MTQPQAVVFDIGNVLLEWSPERFYDGTIGPERRRALFEAVDLGGMNALVDLGAPLADSVAALAEDHPGWASEIRMWQDNWSDMATPLIDHSVRLLRALRQRGVPVFALSNFGNETFDLAQDLYPPLKEFDRAFISGHMGVMKPDPLIYQRVEAECGLPPGALFFIDDRADNIVAAARRGWQVHLFERPEGLADLLVAHGLLSEREAQ